LLPAFEQIDGDFTRAQDDTRGGLAHALIWIWENSGKTSFGERVEIAGDERLAKETFGRETNQRLWAAVVGTAT
jgi:hypothetical protein